MDIDVRYTHIHTHTQINIHTMEYYSATEKEILLFART